MSRQEDTHIAVDDEVLLNRQSGNSHKSLTATDIFVYGLILGLGALQFGLSQRSDDYFTGDTIYFELARSIIEQGFYGFNFKPETLLPPGFLGVLVRDFWLYICGPHPLNGSLRHVGIYRELRAAPT